MPSVPLVSIILVTWNSGMHLPYCYSALSKQTRKDFEIVVVDNGSSDGSIDGLEKKWNNFSVTIERLGRNYGFTVGNNIGVRLARGKWVALLNTDAYPEPDWLANLIKTAEQNPGYVGFSSCQIHYEKPDLLDGAGDSYHISGLAWRNSYNLPVSLNATEPREIFSPCAAAALYSRKEFLEVGGFDEDYFSYFEDVDIGFRLRLNGGRSLYVPRAIVYHVGSASTGKRSDFSVYYGYRNLVWTFIKNMPNPWFGMFLPLHIFTIMFFVLYIALRGQGRPIVRAIRDAILDMPKMLVKRKIIQKNIVIEKIDIISVFSIGLFEPLIEFVKRNR